MKYEFPIITHINDVLPAINGRDEFVIADRPGHTVINYAVGFADTFPTVLGDDITEADKAIASMRRECRGIKFDKSGLIICRPMQKFFNLNEKEETQSNKVDIKEPHIILEKLDGSFIAPYIADGRLIYGTKMGETDISKQVMDFIEDKQKYNEISLHLIDAGYTPVFEFTSPANRIVVPYKDTNLTLLTVRHMVSGRYYSYEEMQNISRKYNIPLVKQIPGSVENIQEFIENTRQLQDQEGYVIRFASGYMLKLKADDYVRKHKTKDSIGFEKNIVEIIFSEKVDDIAADLPEEDAAKVKKFTELTTHTAMTVANNLKQIVAKAKEELENDKKRFALEVIPSHKEYSSLMFAIWDGTEPYEAIRKHILKNSGTQTRIDNIRNLLGPVKWRDIYISNIED